MSVDSHRDPLGISGTLLAEKYRIGKAIGEGGFSVVYRAEHTIWQQPVAIKCFKVLVNTPEEERQGLLDGFIPGVARREAARRDPVGGAPGRRPPAHAP